MAQPIAILGGTFDPVHNAHLAVARAALDHLKPEQVVFVPTGTPPYRAAPVALARDRVAMLKLAIAGEPRYAIDQRELAQGASGYTHDTLVSLRLDYPDAPLVLLLGADQYAKIESWHRWQELFGLARITVFARPGWKVNDARVEHVAMAPLDISGSAIRARLAKNEDVLEMVPGAVLEYIMTHRLYR